MITLIVAVGKNNELGKENDLVWHLPNDFKRFKKLTTGHHIIMGRKTFESFPKPLPNRVHVVITRNEKYKREGTIIVQSMKEAFGAAVIAVSSIYGLESEEFARIKQEMKVVNAFHFTPSNVPVDMSALMEELDTKYKPLGFVVIWKELFPK